MNIIKNVPTKLEVSLLGTDGKKIFGLSIDYIIYNTSDYSVVDDGTMAEGVPGVYYVTINIATVGQYWVLYFTPEGYEEGQESFNVIDAPAKEATLLDVAADVDAIQTTLQTILNSLTAHRGLTEERLARILGLVQENYRILDPTYDSNGDLISSTLKLYASKADCNSNINAIATYSVIATYDANHRLTSYKVTKE